MTRDNPHAADSTGAKRSGTSPAAEPSTPAHRPALVPNDHLRLLVELLQPAGPELARRWLAALLLVHKADREAVVRAVELQIARLYPLDEHDRTPVDEMHSSAAQQHDVKPSRRSGRLSA